MKYLILFSFFTLSCSAPKIIPLKGSYVTPPYEIKTEKSFNLVWDRLVDLFAQNGLSIKIIDRSSGLIVAGFTEMEVTYEDKNGILKNPKASLVTNVLYNWGANKYAPLYNIATGDWNVRIKESDSGTLINVNVVNVKYYDAFTKNYKIADCKSTGVFEKLISDYLIRD